MLPLYISCAKLIVTPAFPPLQYNAFGGTHMNESAIRLHIEEVDPGIFVATSEDVPGLVAQGRSMTEAAEIAQGLARKFVESCLEHGDPLPPALALPTPPAKLDLIVPVGIG